MSRETEATQRTGGRGGRTVVLTCLAMFVIYLVLQALNTYIMPFREMSASAGQAMAAAGLVVIWSLAGVGIIALTMDSRRTDVRVEARYATAA